MGYLCTAQESPFLFLGPFSFLTCNAAASLSWAEQDQFPLAPLRGAFAGFLPYFAGFFQAKLLICLVSSGETRFPAARQDPHWVQPGDMGYRMYRLHR